MEVIIVDPRTPDYHSILANIKGEVEVLILDTNLNGPQQILEFVSGREDISALHILSHGNDGVVLLGDGALHTDNLQDYQAELSAIGNTLANDADILLYGCNIAASEKGTQFIQQLASMTGADVAASDDDTGTAIKGGDTELEIAQGDIETDNILAESLPDNYQHLLHTASVSNLSELNTAISSAVGDGSDDVITLTAEIELSGTQVSINVTDGKELTIVGGGNAIDGNHQSRVLDVTSGDVKLDNITIKNGLLSGDGGNFGNPNGNAGGDALGAGLAITGNATVTLLNSTITANHAAGGGGGSTGTGGAAGGGYGGGGGSGFNSTGGGTGGTGNFAAGMAGSSGSGGRGGLAYNGGVAGYAGQGGTTSGGAGGNASGAYGGGGAGGTAGTIGGGGGGGAGNGGGTGGNGGNAVGGVYIATGATLNTENSTFSSNLGAGGGGGGAGTGGGTGGAGGSGIGSVWVKGTFNYNSGNTTFTSNTGTGGTGGGGNTSGAIGTSSGADYLNTGGTVTKNFTSVTTEITSAIYDAAAGVLTVSGTDFAADAGDDIDVSKLTLTGDNGNTYTLTSANVEITSATEFSVTLNAADKTNIGGLLNKDGTTSDAGTTYNLAAATGWMPASASASDTTGNGINVSNVTAPAIDSATYDASTGALVVTGTNFVNESGTTNDIDVSTLTLTGDNGATYTLTTSDIEITSATSFTVTLNATDLININGLLNKDGSTSDSGTTYNLAAADNWMPGAAATPDIADATNGINVSNVTNPTIGSATYDAATGALVVTGTNFVKEDGSTNDVDVSTFTFTGDNNATYTLTSASDVEITSDTSFTITLSATDKLNVGGLLNKDGLTSDTGTTYNLAAADNWMPGAAATPDIADATNGINVSNVTNPTIGSATYDAATGALVVTGTNFVKEDGSTNDVDVSTFTFTGDNNATYTLTSASDVEITSDTSFTITLSATDKLNVGGLLNKDGLTSDTGTTYNLAAADNWMPGAAATPDIADATNGINVSNVTNPTIGSATYDAATGALVVTGTNFVKEDGSTNDVDVSTFTFTGDNNATYTLTSASDVEITSDTSFTITLSATDKLNVGGLLNKDGLTSDTGTTYNLAAADNWMPGAAATPDIADGTNGINVSNVTAPTITSATYNASTNTLVVSGTNFVAESGVGNDVDISTLTLTGEDGGTYTLTSASDVEVTSATEFTVTLADSDLTAVESLLNKNGATAESGTIYNLAAADNWMPGAPAAADIADTSGNAITVSNYAGPAISSSTYNFATGVLVLTGSNFVSNSGGNDVDVTQLTLTGEGGSTYTLTSATSNVNITSDTEITVTLGTTDKLNVNGLLNKDGSQADDGVTNYNLAAAEDWLTGAAASLTTADAAAATVTVSSYAAPTVTDATYDADSGVLVVTGTNFVKAPGADNDIDISTITLTGYDGSSHNLASTSGVEITSATSFSVTLTGSDKTGVDALLDQIGTSSSSGTTYNIAAADNWLTGAPASANIADLTLNGITVQVAPKITSAGYDASTGTLTVTGSNIQEKTGSDNDIDASTLTFTGEGGDTYTLVGTADVDRTSATGFTLTLDATDKSAVNQLLNKNGGTSTGGTAFNLSAADDWNQEITAGNSADTTNTLTVSNVAAPAITEAAYDATAGTLTVTGTGFTKRDSQLDIDASLFTLTGESGATYTLVGTPDIEVSSDTSFTLTLDATDKAAVNLMMNKAGTASTAGTTYNLAAAEDWARGADAAVNVADLTGNGITVSNIPAPEITSATYNAKSGALVVTGSHFVKADGAANDIDATKLALAGAMGNSHTLTGGSVEVTSATAFTVTLNSTDKAALVSILDKAGTSSVSGTTYNLRAAEDWAAGADAAVNVADLSGNGITVTLNSAPTSADTTESVPYNGSYTFETGDFDFTDSDSGDTLQHVSINSLPDKGTLKLSGADVNLNADISIADITDGKLSYTPDSGGTGSGYSSFQFSVNDGTADSSSQTVTLNVGTPPPAPEPTPTPDIETIDGVIVEKDTTTLEDGTTSSTVKIDPVTESRQEDSGTDNGDKADIPLRQEADGNAALTVAIPIGIGITAEGNDQAKSAGNSLADLIRLIDETADDDTEAANKGEMLEGGEAFLEALEDQNLWVNKLTLTASSETAPDAPIVVSGNTRTTDNGNDNSQAALVIDTRTLPTGTQLQLQDVEFAVIVGDGVVIRGGEGQNTVFAGSGSQDIVLGADDDQLYGGDGNDTVGSKGGDDLLFGENGNDTLFGGAGKDTLHGGRDIDVVTYDGTMADYDLIQTNGVITVTSKADSTDSDTLVNIEQVQFADGNYLANYDTELKALATLYQNVLGRQADLAGFQWWAEQLDNGASFGDTILGFMQSSEYQGQLSQPFMELDNSAQLDALYQAVLGRAADDKGKNDWLTAIDAGMGILEAAHGFAVSPELLGQLQLSNQWDFTL